ncbi:MAG: MlaE family lipid ABC transporter permease subunit [Pseudomonadota bacterium]
MNHSHAAPASATQPSPHGLTLSGAWTARGLGGITVQLDNLQFVADGPVQFDAAGVDAFDTAGAWVLHKLMARLHAKGVTVALQGLRPPFVRLMQAVTQHVEQQSQAPKSVEPEPGMVERVGRNTWSALEQGFAMLAFLGETALAFAGCLAHPSRMRWRPILFNIRRAGFDALPIVGLLSFLLGIVVAYQGADQLRQYGANIFVADLVGLSMLREFAPLITAITIAGRSGSAFAAQIGTMAVTEEIDAMRTIGIAPLELLVVPKIIALAIALPLLTVFADVMGVFGGMLMARSQLDVGYGEFMDRMAKAVSITSYLVGIGKAPVFALIISIVGCFQGFRTRGGADSVGQQTTRSVVQSIFLVIVADALFSIAFSILDL